jgi:uncharacterized membrane protein (DUF485 family)
MTMEVKEKDAKELQRKKQKKRYIKIALTVGVIVFIIWLIGFFAQCFLGIKSEGVFTTLSTLFSALAFAGVIVTIFMQRDELELQRDEMELTRKEFKTQNKTLSRQRFENTFFQLLQRQSEIRSAIAPTDLLGSSLGREVAAFKVMYSRLEKAIKDYKISKLNLNTPPGFPPVLTPEMQSRVAQMAVELVTTSIEFKKIFQTVENDFGHYFRHLMSLIRFVFEMKVDVKKERYYDFVKSELSQYELLCIFYYGLSDYGIKDFKNLLTKSRLLEDVDKKLLIQEYDFEEYLR